MVAPDVDKNFKDMMVSTINSIHVRVFCVC